MQIFENNNSLFFNNLRHGVTEVAKNFLKTSCGIGGGQALLCTSLARGSNKAEAQLRKKQRVVLIES